jgi:hypothetical protein
MTIRPDAALFCACTWPKYPKAATTTMTAAQMRAKMAVPEDGFILFLS